MKRTKDGKKIETWVKSRKGVPSKIKGTKDLVKIKFDSMEDRLVPITWYDFFQILKDNNLTFMYEDNEESRFCKFVESPKSKEQ